MIWIRSFTAGDHGFSKEPGDSREGSVRWERTVGHLKHTHSSRQLREPVIFAWPAHCCPGFSWTLHAQKSLCEVCGEQSTSMRGQRGELWATMLHGGSSSSATRASLTSEWWSRSFAAGTDIPGKRCQHGGQRHSNVCDGPHFVTISGCSSESNFGLVSVPTWSDVTGAAQPGLQLYDTAYSSVLNSAATRKWACGQERQPDWGRTHQQLPNGAGTEQMNSPPPLWESGTTGVRRERRASMDFSSSYKSCLQFPCRGLLQPHKPLCVEASSS